MATAQHIGNRRTAVGPRAQPRLCQKLIHARGDMSTGRAKQEEMAWRTHEQKITHTHTPAYSSPLNPRLPFKTVDILPFFLAGASHGNSSRNPFSTDAGTAVPILNRTQLVLPLSLSLCMRLQIKTTTCYLIQIYIARCQDAPSSSHLCLLHRRQP